MMNEEHLDLLKQGVEVWNEWRRQNPGIRPELDLAKLRLVSLSQANLRWANLSRVNFQWANLSQADLRWAKLNLANLNRVNFKQAQLSRANLRWTDLSRANLVQADLRWTDLSFAKLSQANLAETDLRDAALNFANLSGADLSGADFTGANLSGANLTDANLTKANLTEANLAGAKVAGTNFTQTVLFGACLDAWIVSDGTKLDRVIRDDVSLVQNSQENDLNHLDHSSKPNFEASQQDLNTVDLTFRGGIDWQAFLLSFQDLQAKYGEQNLSIRAIEHQSDLVLIIRLTVLSDLDKTDIERHLEAHYSNQLSALKSEYYTVQKATDEQIAVHLQQGVDLLEIVKLQAIQPIAVETDLPVEDHLVSDQSSREADQMPPSDQNSTQAPAEPGISPSDQNSTQAPAEPGTSPSDQNSTQAPAEPGISPSDQNSTQAPAKKTQQSLILGLNAYEPPSNVK